MPMFFLTLALGTWVTGLFLMSTIVSDTIFEADDVDRTAAVGLVATLVQRFNWVELSAAVIALGCWLSLKQRFAGAYRNRRTVLSLLLGMIMITLVSTLGLIPRMVRFRPPETTAEPAAASSQWDAFRRHHGTYLVLAAANTFLGLAVLFVISRHAVRSLNAAEEKRDAAERVPF